MLARVVDTLSCNTGTFRIARFKRHTVLMQCIGCALLLKD